MGVEEKALGQRLQAARRRAGLTQQALCQKAGLSYSTLAKIERGAIRSPSVFTVATIAAATNSSLEKLVGLDGLLPPAQRPKKTSKTGVKFVYFDLNNTLVRSYEKAFGQIAEEIGWPLDAVEAAYWRYNSPVCRGDMSLEEFNQILGRQFNIENFDWSKYYLDVVEPTPGMDELVKWTAAHYDVGILSGTFPGLIKGLTSAGKLPAVDYSQIIDSSVVKCLKSEHKIFEIAQQAAGVEAKEILLVDDDRTALINADELGWQICSFNTYEPDESIERVKQHLAF